MASPSQTYTICPVVCHIQYQNPNAVCYLPVLLTIWKCYWLSGSAANHLLAIWKCCWLSGSEQLIVRHKWSIKNENIWVLPAIWQCMLLAIWQCWRLLGSAACYFPLLSAIRQCYQTLGNNGNAPDYLTMLPICWQYCQLFGNAALSSSIPDHVSQSVHLGIFSNFDLYWILLTIINLTDHRMTKLTLDWPWWALTFREDLDFPWIPLTDFSDLVLILLLLVLE